MFFFVFFCCFVAGWLEAEATELVALSNLFTFLETNILLMEEIRLTI